MWQVIQRKHPEHGFRLVKGTGEIKKIHSNLYEWRPVQGTAIVDHTGERVVSRLEFVSEGAPCLGGYLVLSQGKVPTYMPEGEYHNTFS